MDFLRLLSEYNGALQLVSITIVPFVIVALSNKFQKRQTRNQTKRDLFLKLMANRKAHSITQEWVDSLNQICVVFQGDTNVLKTWNAYYESLYSNDVKRQNTETYLIELLSEIAQVLGYRSLSPTQIANFYTPQHFLNSGDTQDLIAQENIRILTRSKSLDSEFEDKEFHEHLNNLLAKTQTTYLATYLQSLRK
jgi:hypothetical protein